MIRKTRLESAIQFEDIYEKHHDPEERAKRKILENRKKREEDSKNDSGL